MKSMILKSAKSSYMINLHDIFDSFAGVQNMYNWLITDYECNHYPSSKIGFNGRYVFLSGEELTEIVFNNEIQFIWGVFSAIRKSVSLEEILEYPLPYAEGNEKLCEQDVFIQNPLAEIEIVAWDASFAIVIFREESTFVDLMSSKSNF